MLQRMQKPQKEKIKMSRAAIQKVLMDVYFPLLEEADRHLSKLNKLYKHHSWTYFKEPEPPKYGVPMTPTYDSLKGVIDYLWTVTKKEREIHFTTSRQHAG